MRKGIRIRTFAVALVLLLVSVFSAVPASALGGKPDKVRVGYYIQDRFQMYDEKTGEMSGYGYEYLQKVAQYGGFDYEYVFGTYDELCEKVRSGEIDTIIYCVADYLDTSVSILGEANVMVENYYPYRRSDDYSINSYDISSYNGKTFGILEGTNEAVLLTSYIDSFVYWFTDPYDAPSVTVVSYTDMNQLDKDFRDGKIDVLIDKIDYEKNNKNAVRLNEIGGFMYFMATAIDENFGPANPLLAEKIESAIVRFLLTEPGFTDTLRTKYYGDEKNRLVLSESEQEYIKNHPTLKVGYLDDFLPFCGTDGSGKMTGVLADVLGKMAEVLDMKETTSVEFIPYSSSSDMLSALESEKIDLIFPFLGSSWNADEMNLSCTNSVMNSDNSIVVKGSFDRNAVKKLAICENNFVTSMVSAEFFPDAEMVPFKTTEECLDAVLSGKADAVILSALRAGQLLKNRHYRQLSAFSLQKTSDVRMGVKRENTELFGILNRGIYGIDADFTASAAYDYIDGLYSYNTWDSVLDNLPFILGVLAVILIVIIVIIVSDAKKRNKVSEAHHRELEAARQQADDANNAKTEFLFNMSHDIRTPMNAIMGFTGMAIKHIDDKEKAVDCLEKTQKAGNMLLSLINSVLEVSRIESGHATLEEQPGDVLLSFVNIENTMQEMAETKDIKLTFDFGEIRNRFVFADFDRCMRIFVNIISNAIKYTPDGGLVDVRCEQLGEAKDGFATYQYTIADNGIGMSEEFQKHIFEQFAREQTSTVSGIQGSGLGMSVVKSFVDLLGGSISVRSKQGEGSTFTIVLPFRLQDKEEYTDPLTGEVVTTSGKGEEIEEKRFAGKKVLLVEDNELNREIAIEILEEEGLAVEDAEDGLAAVTKLKEKGPGAYDFILMDIQMPVMNGYEATKAIREMYPDSKLPIIALSANAFTEDKEASIAAGMDEHVAKPINIKELFNALAKFL